MKLVPARESLPPPTPQARAVLGDIVSTAARGLDDLASSPEQVWVLKGLVEQATHKLAMIALAKTAQTLAAG